MKMYAILGENCIIKDNVIIGLKYSEDCSKTVIGNNAIVREGSWIYADVEIGDDFITGHSILIREKTKIGNRVIVGTNTVIDGNVEMGSYIKLETNVYIPTHARIGSYVFIGPGAVLTNDKYPQRLRDEYKPIGPVLEDGVTIGANATILPDIKIGKGSFIAAGSVVTEDIPEWSFALGVPAKIKDLPEKLKEMNRAKSW
jgi:acetyltransferase-like isoleucine patch superfamily enzyme